jgi:acyl transferase domain-containing protein
MTLALENGVIPQTIGVKTINPKLLLEERNVRIATSNTLWPSGDVRRASINSFGYGGSNGHVILEGAESHVTLSTSSSTGTPLHCRVIPLSARSDKGLQLRRNALAKLERTTRLADVAYTLSCRRSHFESRGFLVVTDEEWTSLSESKPMKTALLPKKKPEIVFAFTGQGAQWPTMGAVLIHTCQRFAETIDSLDSYLSTIPEAPKWRLRGKWRRLRS